MLKILNLSKWVIVFLLFHCMSQNVFSNGSVDTSCSTRKKILRLLELEDIQSGYREAYFRIWIDCSLSDSGMVINFKERNDKWYASVIYYKIYYTDNSEIDYIQKKVENGVPASGWGSFTKELQTMESEINKKKTRLEGFNSCMDGNTLTLEISDINSFVSASFACFDNSNNNAFIVKKIKKFLVLIRKEFGFKMIQEV